MDFQSLSRRELQALCKKNKIPANITNVAMVEALSLLEKVEGIDELMNAVKSEPQQSPVKDMPASPANPQTACRTRRKVKVVEPESSKVGTRTRRATRKTDAVESKEEKENGETPAAPATQRRATAASACRKLEIQVAETETVVKPTAEEHGTPAVQSRRRRAPTASTLKKQEAQKEIGSVQGAYSTRRSVRLLEKCTGDLSLTENEEVEKNANAEVLNNQNKNAEEKEENEKLENTSTEELNNENQNGDVEDKEENVPRVGSAKASEDVALNNAVEPLEANQESEINVIPEAVLEESNSLIDSSEIDAEGEDKIDSSGLSSVVTTGNSEVMMDDARRSVEECEIKDEAQVDNENIDSTKVEEQDDSVTESDCTPSPESELEKPLNETEASSGEVESVEVSTDLMDDVSSSMNTEVFGAESEQNGETEEVLNEKEDSFAEVESVEVSTDLTDDIAAAQISKPDNISRYMNVEEFMAESEQPQPEERQQIETFTDAAEESKSVDAESDLELGNQEDIPDSLPIESSATKELCSCSLTTKTEMDTENMSADYDTEALINVDITETKEELITTTSNVSDAPESENNSGYQEVPNTEVTGEIASETLVDVQISQAVNYGNNYCIPQTQSSSTPAKSVLSGKKKAFSPFAADTIQGQFPRLTTVFTPTKASAGKQQVLPSFDVINKENIDNGGMKLEEAKKDGDKNKNLEDMSMRMLTKMLKEKLQIKNKSIEVANNVGVKVGDKVEKRRPALQTLAENCMPASTAPENKNY